MARHVADTPPEAPTQSPDGGTTWSQAALWTARSVLVAAVLVIVAASVTRATTAEQGAAADGTPSAVLRNAAFVGGVVLGIGWQWFSGLAATSSAARRDGDDLVAVTVLGLRRIRLTGASVVRFRLPSKVGTVHGAAIVDRRCRPLVLLDPIGRGDVARIRALTGTLRDSAGSALAEYLFGAVWLATTVVVTGAVGAALFLLLGGPVP